MNRDTITLPRSVVEQALEALEYYEHRRIEWDYADEQAITALRAALEQPQVEQEPVAYATHDAEGSPSMLFFDRREAEGYCDDGEEPTPLYTHPQPKREPLTDEQIRAMWCQFAPVIGGSLDFARAIERAHGIGGEA